MSFLLQNYQSTTHGFWSSTRAVSILCVFCSYLSQNESILNMFYANIVAFRINEFVKLIQRVYCRSFTSWFSKYGKFYLPFCCFRCTFRNAYSTSEHCSTLPSKPLQHLLPPFNADIIFHTATTSPSSAIVPISPRHHSGRFVRTSAVANGGQTAFPHRATCLVFLYSLPR